MANKVDALPMEANSTAAKPKPTLRSRRLKKALDELGWNTGPSVWRCSNPTCGNRVHEYVPFCCMCGRKLPKKAEDQDLAFQELERALQYTLKEVRKM